MEKKLVSNFQKIKVSNAFAIGGMIGAGKSTLSRALGNALDAAVVYELKEDDHLQDLLLKKMYSHQVVFIKWLLPLGPTFSNITWPKIVIPAPTIAKKAIAGTKRRLRSIIKTTGIKTAKKGHISSNKTFDLTTAKPPI